jgi:multidrug efflux pump subunit AcrB
MLAAIALMYAAGLTINMISLFALIITLGIVVDDAIVVGEHADFRARRLARTPSTRRERAPRMARAGVFGHADHGHRLLRPGRPSAGAFGDLIADIPFTVIVVLLASLVECFLILPNHMAHALAHSRQGAWYDWPSPRGEPGVRLGARAAVPPAHGLGDLGALPGAGGRDPGGCWPARWRCSSGATCTWRFFNAPEQGSVSGNFRHGSRAPRATTRWR